MTRVSSVVGGGMQSLSMANVQLAGQHPSPLMHIVMGLFVHAALHVAALPLMESIVHALLSLQLVGQLAGGSHVSPASTILLPHTGILPLDELLDAELLDAELLDEPVELVDELVDDEVLPDEELLEETSPEDEDETSPELDMPPWPLNPPAPPSPPALPDGSPITPVHPACIMARTPNAGRPKARLWARIL